MTRTVPSLASFLRLRGSSPRGIDDAGAATALAGIMHEGRSLPVVMRRVSSVRRFTLRVRSARRDVLLTMPKRATLASARDFAQRHAAWIAERLAALEPPVAFATGAEIPLGGVPHRLERRPGLRRRVWIEEQAGLSPPRLCVSGPETQMAPDVARFLRREALTALTQAVGRHAAAVGRPVKSLTLKDTRSRWGSCSSTGALNFSWRLVMAPHLVLDYLAAHEVAHLVHMDHSDAFWAVTRQLAPRMDEAEAWLKIHGRALHRYGDASPARMKPR